MQHYPDRTLYVVATPIGNLADITLRALHVLELVDAIACEDTRHTRPLLRQYGIDKPLLAVHEHNEAQAASLVIERLQRDRAGNQWWLNALDGLDRDPRVASRIEGQLGLLESVTPADLQRAAQRFLTAGTAYRLLILPEAVGS